MLRPRHVSTSSGKKSVSQNQLSTLAWTNQLPTRDPPDPLEVCREQGNRALAIVLQSRPFLRLQNAFKYSVFGASTLVSTKTLLLKHCYRRQGSAQGPRAGSKCFWGVLLATWLGMVLLRPGCQKHSPKAL